MPLVVAAGVPILIHDGFIGGRVSYGTIFLFVESPTISRAFSASFHVTLNPANTSTNMR
jgi:hypothetical protein